MNFLLTKYIYPIKEKICLSEKYGFYLDNPRTKEEIDSITKYVNKSYDFSLDEDYNMGGPRIPIVNSPDYPDSMTLEKSLQNFYSNYGEVDKYIKQFQNQNSNLNPLDAISKMWVIVRYNDEGEILRLKKEKKRLLE